MARKNRVLIVEDNADVRELMVLYLRRAGYEIAEAATGLAALEQAPEILHKPTDFQTILESVQRYSSVIGEGTFNVRESEGSPPAVAHA
jgi:CheY-like chemotaxis protein